VNVTAVRTYPQTKDKSPIVGKKLRRFSANHN